VLPAYADENLDLAVVQALRGQGMDIVTVQERGRRGADDGDLLDEALSEKRLFLTNDQDLLSIAALRYRSSIPFAPICYWPQQRRKAGAIATTIVQLASTVDYGSLCSRVLFF
jgi:hypothetical protein